MDGGGQRENRRHAMDYNREPPWNMINQQDVYHTNVKISMLCNERDVALAARDRALAARKAALAERDVAVQQRDMAIAERDNAVRERENAIAALQFQESTMSALSNGGTCGLKRVNPPTKHRSTNIQSAPNLLEEHVIDNYFSLCAIPPEAPKSHKRKQTEVNGAVTTKPAKSPKKAKKVGEDLNRHVTTDGSKAEWDAQGLGKNLIHFEESTMPIPVCSCTGVPRQCYKWGSGGWQSSCCTTSLSVYPLPQMPNKRHSRMAGRKMSGSVFSRLLTRLAEDGHDFSVPVDLKNYWAKHGTNRYITIK